MNRTYTRQNPYVGACLLVLTQKKFVEMAVLHGMAENLESDGLRKLATDRGDELLDQWEKTYRSDYEEMRGAICSSLWSSFWMIVFASALSFGIGVCFDRVGLLLPIDTPKAIAFVGSALVAWATLMELGGDFPVWDGKAFPQMAHSVVFKAIFLPGILMILTSILL